MADPQLATKPIGQVVAALPGVLAGVADDWRQDTSWLWLALAGVGLAAATVYGVTRRRAPYLMAVVMPVVLVGLTLIHRVIPLSRVWLFALPLLLAVCSCGLADLVTSVRTARGMKASVALVLAATAAATACGAWQIWRRDYLPTGDATFPDARAIVSDCLTLADGHTSLTWDYEGINWPPLDYYSVTLSTPARQFVPYLDEHCRRVLLIVGPGQDLPTALKHRPLLDQAYGPMLTWQRCGSTRVYLAGRRP